MIRRKATETKTLTPNFSSGNVDVTPSANKTMTKVTIQKDSDLIAGNVKKDVEIHGITGTYEGGGSTSGDYSVRFMYLAVENGILVDKITTVWVNSGGTVTAPTIASTLDATTKRSCALTFYGWNYTDLTNITHNLDVGAIYYPTDNKTHAFVTVNTVTGLSPSVYFNKSDSSTLTISWGDGTSDYTTTSSGNLNTSHTYSTAGTYEITMWISSGTGTYNFSNASASTTFIGGNTQAYRNSLINLFIGSNVTEISAYAFDGCDSLNFITLKHGITSIGDYAFYYTSKLTNISIPSSTTSIGTNCFNYAYGLQNISIPTQVTSIGGSCFSFCYSLKRLIFSPVTRINAYTCENCYSLAEVFLSSGVTVLDNGSFFYCYSLKNIVIPNTVTTVGSSVFSQCYSLNSITFSSNLTQINNSIFSGCSALENVSNIPSSVSSIGSDSFNGCLSVRNYTLSRYTAPSTITTLSNTSAFTNIKQSTRIYVPVGSLSVYQGATNWSTYANYMYEDTAQNRALFGD